LEPLSEIGAIKPAAGQIQIASSQRLMVFFLQSDNQMEAEEAFIAVLVAVGLIVLAVLTVMLFF
jgi:hypothetical protein